MIDPIAAMSTVLGELQSLATTAAGPSSDALAANAVASPDAAAPNFSQMLKSALTEVNGSISQADGMAKSFSAGDSNIPLSDVMIALEKANLALQMAAGVRDKVVAAYTSVMNMQV
jgi:flagellar hook-basal body complex protein FliE